VPCDLCGAQPNLKRQEVKRLLAQLEPHNPLLRKNLIAAIANVKPTHLWDLALREGELVGRDPWLDEGLDPEDQPEMLAQLRVD
jgi:tRNA 2-thiocytidine biosynthesis protein TtcA